MKKFDTKKKDPSQRYVASEEDLRKTLEEAHYKVLGESAVCNLHKAMDNIDDGLLKKAYVKEYRASSAECLDHVKKRICDSQQIANIVDVLGRMPKDSAPIQISAPEAMPDSDGKCGPNLSVTIYQGDLYEAMKLLLRSRIDRAANELQTIGCDLEFDERYR